MKFNAQLFSGSTLLIQSVLLATIVSLSPFAMAHDDHKEGHGESGGHHFVPAPRLPNANPSDHYSGNTPVNRKNGNFFNTGTQGAANEDYEKWATTPTWAVSLSERPYSYEQKKRFIATLDERIQHFETAVWNYSKVTDISKPEGKAHAEQASAELKPRIEKAREAWSKAKSAGRGEWEQLQNEAKRSFQELQSFYYGMHKNVR